MIKELIYKAICLRLNRLYFKKLNHLMKGKFLNKTNLGNFILYKNYWKKKNLKAKGAYYKLYSSISNNPSPNYVPENLYYTYFEPALNNKSMLKAYSNKNLYHKIYTENDLFPKVYARAINGVFYTSENQFCEDLYTIINSEEPECFIIKIALDSGGGRGVELFTKTNSNYVSNNGFTFDPSYLINRFGSDFVIQEYIQQNDFFNRFNKSSLNTIRVFTYRSVIDEKIHILHAVLRIGKAGSIVDNQASGGMSCGIKNKKLNSFAIDKNGTRFSSTNNYKFEEQKEIPFYDELINAAKKIASQNQYARLLGLDLCVDSENKIRLLEVNNSNNEINFYQMNNGPLFGEFTEEIVNWCSTQPKTICIDFSI